ncbi:WD repeat-containing protein slp1 [Escovopsis weberi]|uniref:WD repeat-containing protein slp1 n=1 Tax=Escovopsis weberi TaxID=150374 RepID=A0A0M8N4A3_ESCWE|nr:WD repeat-containing protein slp1 [Escovopsis weberi]
MASADVSTPVNKAHKNVINTRNAAGRAPLTPSPSRSVNANPANANANANSSTTSPSTTPEKRSSGDLKAGSKPVYSGNLMAHYNTRSTAAAAAAASSSSATTTTATGASQSHRDSPKSNIARTVHSSPRKVLELGVSNFSLAGTGNELPSKSRRANWRPKTTKTTVTYSGDRFIPNRATSSAIANSGSSKLSLGDKPKTKSGAGASASSGTVVESSATVLSSAADDAVAALGNMSILDDGDGGGSGDDDDPETYARPSPNTVAYQDSLANACGVRLKTRILEFKPAAPESSKPIDLRQQYNRPLKANQAGSAQSRRRIATAPERVLDAPGLIDDYYLNLLDWSSGNQVAIGLERSVYVWSADEGSVSCLFETTADTYVSSVKWSEDGAYVGVGLGTGEVQIWDVSEGQKTRSMFGHDTRVGVLGWSKHLLSTGARSGLVFNHDVRVAEHKVAELASHTSEVCGLEWRSDGAQLATGGNDNLVTIWDARSLSVPKFSKTNHKAAVKALSWCPWSTNLLATGGGSYDRHIHFWNTTTGARVNSIDTGSQVTSLRWSTHYREIVSSSGFPDNSLSVWSYPTLVRNVEIPAHESRVLHSCLSPDGQMLATAAADESLKFWKMFEKKAGAAGGVGGAGASSKADMVKQMTIR